MVLYMLKSDNASRYTCLNDSCSMLGGYKHPYLSVQASARDLTVCYFSVVHPYSRRVNSHVYRDII